MPLLVATVDLGFATGPLAVIALLSGLALALWRSDSAATVADTDATDADPVRDELARLAAPASSPATVEPALAPPEQRAPALGQSVQPPRLRRPRPPSILGRMTLGVAVIVAAGGALIDELNGGRLHPEQWLGAAAAVCGLGLLVGTLRGSARWLIVPAALFAVTGYGGGQLARAGIAVDDIAGERFLYVGADSAGTIGTDVGFGSLRLTIADAPANVSSSTPRWRSAR